MMEHEHEEKSSRSKISYHLMLFVDGKEGQIRQMGISQKTINVLVMIALLAIVLPVIGWKLTNDKAYKLQARLNETTAKLEETEKRKSELELENTELNKKVTIISDTLNAKVQQENQLEEESQEAHMPSGFPLSASASMEKSKREKTPNRVILTASEGSSVIATGDGVVKEITSDTGYTSRIVVDHGNGYESFYYNDSIPMVNEGDRVIAKSVLFVIGEDNQGVAYEITKEGKEVDPLEIIKIDG